MNKPSEVKCNPYEKLFDDAKRKLEARIDCRRLERVKGAKSKSTQIPLPYGDQTTRGYNFNNI